MTRRLPLMLMLGVFLVIITWGMYTYVTSKYPGANDFYQRWRGSRAFFVEGRDLYSQDVARQIEYDLYGAPASSDPDLDQYPGDFLYPFHAALVIAPLTVLSYAWASAIWLVAIGALVATSFIMSVDLFRWRPSSWLLLFGIFWAVTFYPSFRGLFLGQIGAVAACLEIITLWALVKNHDRLAGLALALSTIKPQIGVLIVPFLLLWSIRYGRWRFVISFVVVLAALMALSFLLLPNWLPEWLAQIARYPSYTGKPSPILMLTTVYLPFLGQAVGTLLSVLLVGILLWAWWHVLVLREQSMFTWTVALTLLITHLVLPRTATPHYILFIFILVFYFRFIDLANRRLGPLLVVGLMLGISMSLWWLFLNTLKGNVEQPINYLPLPYTLFVLVILTRQWWLNTPLFIQKTT